ncbi:LysE family translocator [Ochrovirga pacifica]|uniref:LysE family translocator n=1 Tax=Ochrovirga pacifica TaxID=1042376 RepID=UPI000255A241|nr:LysE family translocator [Ochrovirga pacifica]
MEGILHLPFFVFSSFLLIITPGPDFIFVVNKGISEGRKSGVLAALGIGIGLLFHTSLAAIGISAIIKASEVLYLAVKFIGAVYILYLGFKALKTVKETKLQTYQSKKKSKSIQQGIVTNLFNPKTILTFLAYLPQFVDSDIHNTTKQLFLLGIILTILAVIWFLLMGFFAGSIGVYVSKNKQLQKIINTISAITMILLGLIMLCF